MSNRTNPTPTATPAEPDLPLVVRAMAVVERAGNALPHPFWLFWLLSAILAVVSAIMAGLGVSVVSPGDGETVVVRSLLSGDGLSMAVSTMTANFAEFPPMATIVVVIMGVAVAERTGFLAALMRAGVSRVPASWVVFAVAFTGTAAHVASAAAYVILVPLGGLAFRAVGRSRSWAPSCAGLPAALPQGRRHRHARVLHAAAGGGHDRGLDPALPGLVDPRHPARPGRTRPVTAVPDPRHRCRAVARPA